MERPIVRLCALPRSSHEEVGVDAQLVHATDARSHRIAVAQSREHDEDEDDQWLLQRIEGQSGAAPCEFVPSCSRSFLQCLPNPRVLWGRSVTSQETPRPYPHEKTMSFVLRSPKQNA